MKEFYYKAKRSPNDITQGVIKAENKNSALMKLSDEGLFPFELKEKQSSKNIFKQLFSSKKASISELSIYTRNIADLLEGGIPVLEVFTIIAKQTSHTFLKKITQNIRKDLQEGQSLSWSMQNQETGFSPLFVNLVKAGEASGTLEASFLRIADFYEKKNTLKNSLIKSLAYPSFLFLIGILTIGILFTVILPNLIPVFEDMDVNIPLITKILLNISNVLEAHWQVIIIAIIVLILIARKFLTTNEGRIFYQKTLLKLPYVRTIVLKKELSESFYSFGTLIKNGVPPAQALLITKDSANNLIVKKELETILNNFKKGKSISQLMESSTIFFPECVNMVRVGEKTGSLDKPLLKLSAHYQRDVQSTLEMFITIIEPVMILIFGATIGFIAIAILLPIFQLNFSVT
ncbi:MAG: type II secretion system F family protein [Candidatus Aureabacteria bacterium]|nr:type II secretion system F family protein [Candidatus Auribacterota bacterium]